MFFFLPFGRFLCSIDNMTITNVFDTINHSGGRNVLQRVLQPYMLVGITGIIGHATSDVSRYNAASGNMVLINRLKGINRLRSIVRGFALVVGGRNQGGTFTLFFSLLFGRQIRATCYLTFRPQRQTASIWGGCRLYGVIRFEDLGTSAVCGYFFYLFRAFSVSDLGRGYLNQDFSTRTMCIVPRNGRGGRVVGFARAWGASLSFSIFVLRRSGENLITYRTAGCFCGILLGFYPFMFQRFVFGYFSCFLLYFCAVLVEFSGRRVTISSFFSRGVFDFLVQDGDNVWVLLNSSSMVVAVNCARVGFDATRVRNIFVRYVCAADVSVGHLFFIFIRRVSITVRVASFVGQGRISVGDAGDGMIRYFLVVGFGVSSVVVTVPRIFDDLSVTAVYHGYVGFGYLFGILLAGSTNVVGYAWVTNNDVVIILGFILGCFFRGVDGG